ncbi:MAG: IS630 family transposase [Treponema sp.]|jgi:transposase|nr:IS630 family transposase [Treponema sp.]
MKTQLKPNASPEELAVMKILLDSGKLQSKFAVRLLAILNLSNGKTMESTAESLNISLSSLFRYVKRFNAEGLESLLKDKTRKPGKIPVSEEKKNELCRIACAKEPDDAVHWSVRSLAKRVGISKSSVNTILRERGINPHQVETSRFSNDDLFEEKADEVAGLYMNPPDNAIILCVDEKSQIQTLERTLPQLPLRENIPARQTADYVRYGTAALFAALNVLTGEAAGECTDHHTSEDYLEFLKRAARRRDAGKVLHIITDNYAAHKSKDVNKYLESMSGRYKVHFIASHSSWLNLVERWFAEITNKRIGGEGVKELTESIKRYIKEWNKNSKPFLWTKSAKTIRRRKNNARAAC